MKPLTCSIVATHLIACCIISQAQTSTSTDLLDELKIGEQSRHVEFDYELGSLKPKKRQSAGGMGGMGMGEMGMGGPGMGMGMGGGFGGGEGYGGESGGYGDGMDGDVYGPGRAGPATRLTIYAFLLGGGETGSRSRVELLINKDEIKYSRTNVLGYGGEEGYGSQGGEEDYEGYGGEGGYAGYGGASGGSDGGPRSKLQDSSWRTGLRRLKWLTPEFADQGFESLPEIEFRIVSDSIRQALWKEENIKAIHQNTSNSGKLAKLEGDLKKILAEMYDTQLLRQDIEVERIEQRVAQLKKELERRRAAKQRVVDVQAGRIVLEAQGLLQD